MTTLQEQNYQWFQENYQALSSQYDQKYIAIKNKKVLGAYSSYADGVRMTEPSEAIGSFIVQYCDRGDFEASLFEGGVSLKG